MVTVAGVPASRLVGRLPVGCAAGPIARMFPVRRGEQVLIEQLALDPRGTYRVEVRIAPGPLTGTDTVTALAFDLDLVAADARG